jgi:oxalate decarboxylase/phosphoglucose isomerase-like protein (cupin superfamily)
VLVKEITMDKGIVVKDFGGYVRRVVHPQTVGSNLLVMSLLILNPGDEHIRHNHEFEETIFPLSGTGTMDAEMEDGSFKELNMEKYHFYYIPPNVKHGPYRNTGQEPFICLCGIAYPAPKA